MLTSAVRMPIYLPAIIHQQAHFTATFYVFRNLGVKLLLGVDTIVHQKIDILLHANKIMIRSCRDLCVRITAANPSAQKSRRTHPVRTKDRVTIPPSSSVVVPIKAFHSNAPGILRFVPELRVSERGYGAPHAVVDAKQESVLLTNWLDRPVQIAANITLGWAFAVQEAYLSRCLHGTSR